MKELEKFYKDLVEQREKYKKGYQWLTEDRKKAVVETYDEIIEELENRLYIKEE